MFQPPPILARGRNHPHQAGAIVKLAIDTGVLVVHTEDQGLHTYTMNSVRLCNTHADEKLNDLRLCSDDQILVTDGDWCQVLVRTMFDLRICAMLGLNRHGPIRCIAMTPNPVEPFLFIGIDDGTITVVDQDPVNSAGGHHLLKTLQPYFL